MGHYKIFHTRLATERRANAGVISSFLNHHYTFLPANVPRSILDIYTLKYCIIIIYLFTAIGLLPGGSVYFTCKQNMKLATTRFKSGGLHEKHVVSCFVCTVVDLFMLLKRGKVVELKSVFFCLVLCKVFTVWAKNV